MFNNIKELNKSSKYLSNIPFISKSYEDDQKILNYCKENKNAKSCKCIYPDNDLNNLLINSFNPYYCWYSPCMADDVYITSIINDNKKYCNNINCIIESKDIFLDNNGKITINNTCNSAISSGVTVSKELLLPSVNKSYVLPNIFYNTYFPIFLGLLMIIIK
jgi:hypothetical protein